VPTPPLPCLLILVVLSVLSEYPGNHTPYCVSSTYSVSGLHPLPRTAHTSNNGQKKKNIHPRKAFLFFFFLPRSSASILWRAQPGHPLHSNCQSLAVNPAPQPPSPPGLRRGAKGPRTNRKKTKTKKTSQRTFDRWLAARSAHAAAPRTPLAARFAVTPPS
jgi:hypothetical protein